MTHLSDPRDNSDLALSLDYKVVFIFHHVLPSQSLIIIFVSFQKSLML